MKIKKFIVYYLGDFKDPKKDGWAFVERTRKFETLRQALEKSKELMKKNKEIIQTSIEQIIPPKITQETDMAVVLWNEEYVTEYGEDGIITEFQSKEYELEAEN